MNRHSALLFNRSRMAMVNLVVALLCSVGCGGPVPAHAQQSAATAQQRFNDPQQAAAALIAAARANDTSALRSVLGAGAGRVLFSGDAAQDERGRAAFIAAADERTRVEAQGAASAVLLLGTQEWPLPFPLVREGNNRWRFDTRAGLQEFLHRQIGVNELSALQVARAYVDAQREYVLRDHSRNGLLEYARRLVSSAGRHNGLYWPAAVGEPPSPLGAAMAAAEGRRVGAAPQGLLPYHGYYFRILEAQGPAAPGGAMSYRVGERLIGGFALLAYPARWRVSGVMSFIVNYDGVVFSRDLGRKTASLAATIESYDPGNGWRPETESASATGGAALQGTIWRLAKQSAAAAASGNGPQLQLLEGGRAAGSDGCNRLMGSYTVTGDRLAFGPLASSRMACTQLAGSDAAFAAALARVTKWRLSGQRLELLADGSIVLEFEPHVR